MKTRTSLAMTALALTLCSTGCCMCDAPYDYCGPVYTGGPCGPCCLENERVGSAFTGPYAIHQAGYGAMNEGEYIEGEYIEGDTIEGGETIDEMPGAQPDTYYESRQMSEAPAQPRRPHSPRDAANGPQSLQSALAEVMPQTFGNAQRKPIKR